MRRYFKPITPFTNDLEFLGTILEDNGLVDVCLGGKNQFVNGKFLSLVECYLEEGLMIEITKEEAALLFGRV